MTCMFDRDCQCFEDCPNCVRRRTEQCTCCGGTFDGNELEDGVCLECLEQFQTAYCECCDKEISFEEYDEFNRMCEECFSEMKEES